MNETIPLPKISPEPIELRREAPPRMPKQSLPMRLRAAIALALCVAAVLCKIFVPEGAAQLRRWVVGDGSERLQQAFFSLERSLGAGEDLDEAWSAFCMELKDEPA